MCGGAVSGKEKLQQDNFIILVSVLETHVLVREPAGGARRREHAPGILVNINNFHYIRKIIPYEKNITK